MKKLLSVVLSATLAMTMAVAPAATVFAESTETSTEAAELPDGSDFSIGLVTDVGGVNDGSFNQSAWEGLQKAGEDMGCEVNYLESKTDADYAPNIESFVDDGTDLIICVGYMLADAMKESAEENPDQKYAIIDDSSVDLPNVTCLMFHQEQASYLVGYIAGLVTKSNTIGFVLGMSTDTMNQFGYGYLAGAIDANPDVKVLQYNANNFADSATGKSDANTAITNGADVVFHAAGATGLGVIEACQEAGVWAIGVDSDQSSIAPKTILTSAMKRVDNAVYEAAKETIEGTIASGVKEFDLTQGGVDIAPTTDNIPADVLTKVEDVKQQIIDGKIVVPITKDDFESKYGDVYELDD